MRAGSWATNVTTDCGAGFFRTVVIGLVLVVLGMAEPAPARAPAEPWPVPEDGILAHDPAVVWGRLGNGQRYAVLPNTTPPGRVSLRLLVQAGSLDEADDQRGLAHLLEHMAFEGSQSLPPGELVRYLQREGLAFGPDTNARTGFDSTVYRLDLPRNAADLVAGALGILAEIQGRLLLLPDELEAERGVILSEKRQADTPHGRLSEALLAFLLPGSPHAARLPIGQEKVIREAPVARLRAFYRDHYTPARSIVVVVGDVDPTAIAGLIEERFAGFVTPGDAPGAELPVVPLSAGPDALLVHEPGLPTTVTLSRVLPYVQRHDTLAVQAEAWAEILAAEALSRRLQQLALQPEAPFIEATLGVSDLPPQARLASLQLTTSPDRWRAALALAEQELRRALLYGFGRAELEGVVAALRSRLTAAVAAATTRATPALADALAEAAHDGTVFTAPATDLAMFERLAAALGPATVNAALGRLMGGGPPKLLVAGPIDLAEPGDEILAAYRASQAVEVDAPDEEQGHALAYGAFGVPGEIVARERIKDLDITRLRFANGLRVTYKATAFEADRIRIAVGFGAGRLGLPPDLPGLDLLGQIGFADGGLGRQSMAQLAPLLERHEVGVALVVGTTSSYLIGATTPRDLALQLDLLAAYASDAGYRAEAEARCRQQIEALFAQLDSSPEGPLAGPVERLAHGDDPRFGLPDRAQAEARTFRELRAWLDPALRRGPLDVAVVGDFMPAVLETQLARTFGALPARSAEVDAGPAALSRAPAAGAVRLEHGGPPERALAAVYWPTDGWVDQPSSIALDLVADILGDRLLRVVREAEGTTYTPSTRSELSPARPGRGSLRAVLDAAPAVTARLAALIREVGASLRSGITEDELERALQPRLARAEAALSNNSFWLYKVLVGLERHPHLADDARSLLADHRRQTLAGVQAAARRYLDPAMALEIVILPAVNDSGSSAPGPDVATAEPPAGR
jgi:zinc protease